MASIRFPTNPVWRTALVWAIAWTLLGISCRGDRGVADVMGMGAIWPLLAGFGALAGGVFGAVYAMARRKLVVLGSRRVAGEPLGLKGRAIAGLYGFVVTGVPGTVVTFNPAIGLIGGVVGFVTAVLLPGDADILGDA